MRDEMDGRLWAEHHEAFGEGIDRLFTGIRNGATKLIAAFCRLEAIQFSAPWKTQQSRCR